MEGSFGVGHRTDVVVLRLAGSSVEPDPAGVVVRTPDDPAYRWGNFLLVEGPTAPHDGGVVLDAYRSAFPGETTVRIGLGTTAARVVVPPPLDRLDLQADVALVSTSAPVAPVPSVVDVRAVEGDAGWAAVLRLQRENGDVHDADGVDFLTRQVASLRGAVERGGGRWFGAFAEEVLVGSLGIFIAGGGGSDEARFQAVDVLPAWRGRGTASALLAAGGRWALEEAGARRLVVVAERDSAALRLYRRLGMGAAGAELQWRLSGPLPL